MNDWQNQDRWTGADREYIEFSTNGSTNMVSGEEQLRKARVALDADVRERKKTQEEADSLYQTYATAVYAHRERLVRMTLTFNRAELDRMMPPIIREATIHTRHVAGEEKHKAQRHERVGLFVTDLRRMIGYKTSVNVTTIRSIVACLCEKAVWYDAGELETTFNFPTSGTSGIEPSDLKRWVKAAEMITDTNEYAEVDRLLTEVRDNNDDIRVLLQRADSVGGRAEVAADQLVEFLAQTAAS